MSITSLLVAVLSVAACQSGAPEPSSPAPSKSDPQPVEAPTNASPPASEDTSDPDKKWVSKKAFTLKATGEGDLACYLTIIDDAGTESIVPGGFNLCGEVDALIGKRVKLVRQRLSVPNPTCEGDPDCNDVNTDDYVVELQTVD